jgi:hypothetical protein
MRPNQGGGWIAEGADEQVTISQSLKASGNTDLLQELDSQRITQREIVLARHPEWSGETVSDTLVMILAEDDWEAAHISSLPLLPMTAEQSCAVEGALKVVAGRWTGRKTGVEKPLREVARTMFRVMDAVKN